MDSNNNRIGDGNNAKQIPLENPRERKAKKLLERIEFLDTLITKKLHAHD